MNSLISTQTSKEESKEINTQKTQLPKFLYGNSRAFTKADELLPLNSRESSIPCSVVCSHCETSGGWISVLCFYFRVCVSIFVIFIVPFLMDFFFYGFYSLYLNSFVFPLFLLFSARTA